MDATAEGAIACDVTRLDSFPYYDPAYLLFKSMFRACIFSLLMVRAKRVVTDVFFMRLSKCLGTVRDVEMFWNRP